MKKFKIKNVQNYLYTICDKDNSEYNLIIEFCGEKIPQKDDEMFISSSLIDSKSPDFVQPYYFKLSNKHYEEVKDNKDYILIKHNDFILVYERRYG